MSEWTDNTLRTTSDAGGKIAFDGKNYVCRIENGARIWDLDSTRPGGIYAFRTPNITQEGSYTYSYPDEWTGGKPDEIFVTTVYPTNDAVSQSHFQLVSFDATSVTIFCQNQNTTVSNVFANILLVKSFTVNTTPIATPIGTGSSSGFGNIEIAARVAITGNQMVNKSTNFNVTAVRQSTSNRKAGAGRTYYVHYHITFETPLTNISFLVTRGSGSGSGWTGQLENDGKSAKITGTGASRGTGKGIAVTYPQMGEGSELIFIK